MSEWATAVRTWRTDLERRLRSLTERQFVIASSAVLVLLVLVISLALHSLVELRLRNAIVRAFDELGISHIKPEVDGLTVRLIGTATSVEEKLLAISEAARLVGREYVTEDLGHAEFQGKPASDHKVRLIRRLNTVYAFGQGPVSTLAELRNATESMPGVSLSAFLDVAGTEALPGWDISLALAAEALDKVPDAMMTILPGRVEITGQSLHLSDINPLLHDLRSLLPEQTELVTRFDTPRQHISPYVLEIVAADGELDMAQCHAEDEATVSRLVEVAQGGNVLAEQTCNIGLGAPNEDWPRVAEMAIEAARVLGSGAVIVSDLHVRLTAGEHATREDYEQVAARLSETLPSPYILVAGSYDSLIGDGVAENAFSARLSMDGDLVVSGHVQDELARHAVAVLIETRIAPVNFTDHTAFNGASDSPDLASVLVGLESLSRLNAGELRVFGKRIGITGITGSKRMQEEITSLVSARLGSGVMLGLELTYEPDLDVSLRLHDPESCVDSLNDQVSGGSLMFEPGKSILTASSRATIDRILAFLEQCQPASFEVGGHTDSLGGGAMNQRLSEERAASVVEALRSGTSGQHRFHAIGYGESRPVVSNDTEDGRRANRRIEFAVLESE